MVESSYLQRRLILYPLNLPNVFSIISITKLRENDAIMGILFIIHVSYDIFLTNTTLTIIKVEDMHIYYTTHQV